MYSRMQRSIRTARVPVANFQRKRRKTAENRVLRTSVCCHAMSSRLRTLSCFLVAVLAQDLAAQPTSQDAVIVSARVLKTAKIAFSWTPLIEAEMRKMLRKRSGAVLDVFL